MHLVFPGKFFQNILSFVQKVYICALVYVSYTYIYIYINIGHLIAVLVVYVLKKYGKVSTNLKTSSIEIVNVT